MSKDDAVRISDTIAFIRTATVPIADLPKRKIVADMLHDREQANKIATNISPAMSQGSNYAIKGRDSVQEHRHYRRAIILIKSVLLNVDRNDSARDAGLLPDAGVAAELGNVLAQVTNCIDDLHAKLALLKVQPLQFLLHNNLQVVTAPLSQPYDYAFYFDSLNQVYTFCLEDAVGSYAYILEPVYHVHVQKYAALPTVAGQNQAAPVRKIPGTVVHGADLMVTTQLTGCAIPFYLNGATLVAAHVQPAGMAETMTTDLRDNGLLTMATDMTGVFGAQAPKGTSALNYQKDGYYNYCIGVRSGGQWHLYAQQRPKAYGNHVNAALAAWLIA
jgi:hypothetical protein